MYEAMQQRHRPPVPPVHTECTAVLTALATQLARTLECGSTADCAAAIEELTALTAGYDYLKAMLAHQLEKEVFRTNENNGTHANDLTRGAASTVALARKRDPRGHRSYLANARILAEDTPFLAQRFALGELTEPQAMAILTPLQDVNAARRTAFDTHFRATPDLFDGMGPKQISETVTQYTLQFESHTKSYRIKEAGTDRYLRFTKDRDCIRVNGKLPLAAGTALQQHLRQESRRLRQHGDPRTRTQLQADLFTAYPLAGHPDKLPLALNIKLVMTDKTLFLGDRTPAWLEGYGYIPAQHARELIAGAEIRNEDYFHHYPDAHDDLALRIESFPDIQRLYTAPGDSELIAMDSTARAFPPGLKEFIKIRDKHCRTPYCDGLVEEVDHVIQHHLGGPTNVLNADGRCALCNKAKESPNWVEVPVGEFSHSIRINPGTGAYYRSVAPPVTGYRHRRFPDLLTQSKWVRGKPWTREELEDPLEDPDP